MYTQIKVAKLVMNSNLVLPGEYLNRNKLSMIIFTVRRQHTLTDSI